MIIVSDVGSFVYGVKSSQVSTLKWRAMFRLLERAAFCIFSSTCLLLEPVRVRIDYYYYYYYYYCLYYHSLCWCSFRASAGRKPCTWGISHSSESFCSDTKHLSEDSRRSQHADLLNLCHSSSL